MATWGFAVRRSFVSCLGRIIQGCEVKQCFHLTKISTISISASWIFLSCTCGCNIAATLCGICILCKSVMLRKMKVTAGWADLTEGTQAQRRRKRNKEMRWWCEIDGKICPREARVCAGWLQWIALRLLRCELWQTCLAPFLVSKINSRRRLTIGIKYIRENKDITGMYEGNQRKTCLLFK